MTAGNLNLPDHDSTISVQIDRGAGPPALGAYLFVVFEADRPLAPSARHPLTGRTRVRLGRDHQRSHTEPEPGVLSLGLPDRGVSTRHAQVSRSELGWQVEDLGSKNGTLVNGARVVSRTLADGDWLEIGHTFLLFRAALPLAHASPISSDHLREPAPGLVSLHPALAEELRRLELVAASKTCVLLGGESGSGKEVAALAVHHLSKRPGPFQAVNCGAIAKHLVESELFGYRRGAFSGADEDRPGLIRSADRGTLFLDEIGDLPLPAQAALLRVLQESEVTPVGGTKAIKVDLRLIAASHRDLEQMVEDGAFRADLLARLSGFQLRLPPLRERREDLGVLVAALLRRHFAGRPGITFTADAARRLLSWHWPLNVRELEKCLTTAVVLAGDGKVELAHLPAALLAPVDGALVGPADAPVAAPRPAAPKGPLSPEDQQLRAQLEALLAEHAGNVSAVAAAMGKARFQIQRWVKRLGLDPRQHRPR